MVSKFEVNNLGFLVNKLSNQANMMLSQLPNLSS